MPLRFIQKLAQELQGEALISVNKALVTQASAAIPVVPLYISILYKLMKEQGSHEGCIEQMERLFSQQLYPADAKQIYRDADGRIRLDDREMQPELQQQVLTFWEKVNSDNSLTLTDVQGYRKEFERLFGFGLPGIDYQQDVDANVGIPSIK